MKPNLLTVTLPVLVTLALAGCAPGAAPASQPARGVSAATAPQRTLVIAVRGELPSVASRPLVPVTGALAPPVALFNAALDFVDERGAPHPFLAEALPSGDADTWRVLPDGRMETTYRLNPNLTWQDGARLTSDDFVFAWSVYSTPELGVSTTPPLGQIEEMVAPEARTLVIRWRQIYADAGVMQGDFQPLPQHILADPFQQLDPLLFSTLPFWTQAYSARSGSEPSRATRSVGRRTAGWETTEADGPTLSTTSC